MDILSTIVLKYIRYCKGSNSCYFTTLNSNKEKTFLDKESPVLLLSHISFRYASIELVDISGNGLGVIAI